MERLTTRKYNGKAVVNCEYCKSHDIPCSLYGCRNQLKDRLTEYEDIGMTPEEIRDMKEMLRISTGAIPDNLQELLAADKDERIFILPVKLGTRVFRIVNGRSSKGNNFLNVRLYYASWSNIREIKADFGKTVFLTREEADAAMKNMEG